MTQLYAPVAIGTAATMLVALLVLMRAGTPGHRTFFVLARRWNAAKRPVSGLVLALLSALAITAFAHVGSHGLNDSGLNDSGAAPPGLTAAPLASANAAAIPNPQHSAQESSLDARALAAMRSFAGQLGAKPRPATAQSAGANAPALPDVETMISKLFERLQQNPADVNGWKMLGWSYLNTDRPDEAQKAYETALKLAPDDKEIAQGLEAAKSAQQTPAAAPSEGKSGGQP